MATVLVVDDDPDFLEIARYCLMPAGHEVKVASNGRVALEMMKTARPDVVLLDIMLDYVLEGLDITHDMHRDPQLRDIRVIVVSSLTGIAHDTLFSSDEHVPIDAWLSKPVSAQTLLAEIDKAGSKN